MAKGPNNFMIYIRDENLIAWQKIENKSGFVNEAIQMREGSKEAVCKKSHNTTHGN